ncbi:MAG: hypothetical protein MJ117_04230 [Lachnospiraceae bacterium]|nr:hypothetical protein [Lachnospiraceae bacterium]
MQEPVRNVQDPAAGLATGSMILGLFSVIMIATGFSFIIGSAGIILALLSRGSGNFSTKAKSGLVTSVIGVLGGIAVTVFAFVTIFSGDFSQALERLDSLYETYITQGTLDQTDLDRVLEDDKDQQPLDNKAACLIFPVYEEEADV